MCRNGILLSGYRFASNGNQIPVVDPELNPFENPELQISGVEEAANFLRIRKRKVGKIKLNIFLPLG